ncbi:N-acyl homoserine lactonase family protein [Microbacterium binotii]|uniref:N-acyl homoserine lactonase family protein n=1 Tax=Microbacterium binotii TaxID=462710 RepID=UPI001F341A9F|nr:N-acyl homoserine lactonase family protein [Microbacterium binotii]UIN29256.1 N-acyl homoserine lactonase family protein [Microbacterium binotii]
MSAVLRPSASEDEYVVYAVRYASRDGVRAQHFHHWTPRYDEEHATAYYVWVLRSATRTLLVDAGISPARAAAADGIDYVGSPAELMRDLGVAASEVEAVVLTHLHYDHVGTAGDFEAASLHLQRAELEYWESDTARRNHRESWLSDPEDRVRLRAGASSGRVVLEDGDREIAPGVSVHLVGGHTPGMQVVRVVTPAGVVVIASDASHYYENIEEDRPFAILHDVPGMYAAFDRIAELAGEVPVVLPGHDPAVLTRHPRLGGTAIDVAVVGER